VLLQTTRSADWSAYEAIVDMLGNFLLERGGGSMVLIAPALNATLDDGTPVQFDASRFRSTVASVARRFGQSRASRELRLNAIAPGYIFSGKRVPPSSVHNAKNSTSLCRMGSAMEVSSVVSFLASTESSYVTGLVLPVDGGASFPSSS